MTAGVVDRDGVVDNCDAIPGVGFGVCGSPAAQPFVFFAFVVEQSTFSMGQISARLAIPAIQDSPIPVFIVVGDRDSHTLIHIIDWMSAGAVDQL
jgi:hypothetical protein